MIEQCDNCGSQNVRYEESEGFYECQECEEVWAYAEDDPDNEEMEEDYGTCCSCSASTNVRNIMMLPRKAPIPGTGWGCMVCGLPPDGAVAILCDLCLEKQMRDEDVIKEVIHGYIKNQERCSISCLSSEEFKHKNIPH